MNFLQNLFNRREGGSPVGNALDMFLSGASNGTIRNIFQRQHGETEEQFKNRVLAALGAGVATASTVGQSQTASQGASGLDAFKSGIKLQTVKNYIPVILGGLGALLLLILGIRAIANKK